MIRKTILPLMLACFSAFAPNFLAAQDAELTEIFNNIGNDLKSGDAVTFSQWFADDIEIDVMGTAGVCSRSQARQLMKNFYTKYTPKSFSIVHLSGTLPMRYCIGTLLAGGERFRVTLFVKSEREMHKLQQVRIEKD
ncbi:MAG TPA: DUF4783 domain-containing protein [Bacteroidales bacterium]|jgi:hypothetical protein|nr:DUF4783 domain-containing protein [Bacteroidales bacterium]MCZ2416785.1 DUF4783 domain-containing protein [Burkholderiales bacterium]OQC57671.1 MAG: hypothetical protein BWX52_00872 [Bacteroidetes bacterium ADurb.Bin013]MBP8998750.1 DUF4783 domain-containing protein [Bacteroidales bacterium]MBV6455341.1 hypothetical protein [Bacteroidales bacterium]